MTQMSINVPEINQDASVIAEINYNSYKSTTDIYQTLGDDGMEPAVKITGRDITDCKLAGIASVLASQLIDKYKTGDLQSTAAFIFHSLKTEYDKQKDWQNRMATLNERMFDIIESDPKLFEHLRTQQSMDRDQNIPFDLLFEVGAWLDLKLQDVPQEFIQEFMDKNANFIFVTFRHLED